MSLLGAIEAGGTKFVCAIGTGPDDLRAITRFPTTTPEETIARALAFFREQPEPVVAIGIGAFGPLDLNPASPTFGFITSTPKPGWQQADIRGAIRRGLGVPVAIDTDVNAAAMAEQRWGVAQDADPVLYLTVGTGIGGGVLVGRQPVHGALHPEIGHLLIPHDRADDPFAGACPYHGDCLEGLAAGPALQARWGQPAETLPVEHPAWRLEAHYLALGLVACICTLSPQRIVLGGGVMQQTQLFPLIRAEVQALLNNYLQMPAVLSQIDSYIVPPALGAQAGILGGIALARQAHAHNQSRPTS